MKKMSLRLRLIISFLIVSTCVWTAAAVISWQESRDQMDEFFDTYQLLLARQLSTADWTNLTADMQKKSNRLIENVDDDGEEEDEALGFAVFNRRGEMIFNDDENGRDFIYTPEASGFVNQKIGRKKDMWRIFWLTSADKISPLPSDRSSNSEMMPHLNWWKKPCFPGLSASLSCCLPSFGWSAANFARCAGLPTNSPNGIRTTCIRSP